MNAKPVIVSLVLLLSSFVSGLLVGMATVILVRVMERCGI